MERDRPGDNAAASSGPAARLGGARADFVASLGRKLTDARSVLATVEGEPQARGPRDELRRKLHALGAGARLLRFEAMAHALADAETILDRVNEAGASTHDEVRELAQILDELPSLAWSEAHGGANAKKADGDAPGERVTSNTALIVGEAAIAEALASQGSAGAVFGCERTEDTMAAVDLARSIAPDVVVVDGDLRGAIDLVEALLDDATTDSIPIVVLGKFTSEEPAARFVALGVAKTLIKPVAAEELHAVCESMVFGGAARTIRIGLGDPTMEQLGERLAEEVRRALVDSVDEAQRGERISLGEGTEVLGAIWGAIARVREVVTARTDGVVRFTDTGPEGTIALAPWLHPDVPTADRVPARGRGSAADVRLEGRRIIVADDDPGVTWFITDLLRATGCVVHEALDGATALELAYQLSPDLVVSDILMPKLDGFALSRTLKRDVALRDVPIILLSWKEDLLQRVRELGASAAAYLRKESDARAIVARVREALWPRARVENRLRAGGEVRGRLDGLTVRSLLELAAAHHPDTRVSVRDASYLYELEIRDGAPVRATRTAGDGSFQRGEKVVAAMLGVSAGRFVVAPSRDAISSELEGSLATQLAGPIAAARGAVHVLCGNRMTGVERVAIDLDVLSGYLHATPEPSRGLIEKLARGGSPRKMLLDGEVEPVLLEGVLIDLAVRGVVRSVHGLGGHDMLSPAIDSALAVLKDAPHRSLKFGSLRPAAPPAPTPRPIEVRTRTPSASPSVAEVKVTPRVEPRPALEDFSLATLTAEREVRASREEVPSSLADAVMRELREESSDPAPLVEPSELRRRNTVSSPLPPPLDGADPEIPRDGAHRALNVQSAPAEDRAARDPRRLPAPTKSAAANLAPAKDVARADASAHAEATPAPADRYDVVETPMTPLASVASSPPLPTSYGRGTIALVGLGAVLLAIAAGVQLSSRSPLREDLGTAAVAAEETVVETQATARALMAATPLDAGRARADGGSPRP